MSLNNNERRSHTQQDHLGVYSILGEGAGVDPGFSGGGGGQGWIQDFLGGGGGGGANGNAWLCII